MEAKISWLIRYAVAFVGLVASVMGYFSSASYMLLATLTVLVSLVLCLHTINNRLLLLPSLVLAYLCYSVMFVNYASPLLTTMFTAYRDTAEAGIALSSLLLFLSCLLLFVPNCIAPFKENDALLPQREVNVPFVVVFWVALALILVYGFGRPDAIGSDRGSPTAIYEYSIILFALGFYFAGSSKAANMSLVALLLLFALQNIIYGGRVTALQLLLVLFFFYFSKKVSSPAFVGLVIGGLLVFTFLGSVRTGLLSSELSDLADAWATSANRGFAWDTAYSSWHTSITFLLYGNIIDGATNLDLFSRWLMSIVFGGSVPLCNLAVITKTYFSHQYGGVLPVFFQFYLGSIGVVGVAVYVALLFRLINRACSKPNEGKSNRGILTPVISLCALYIGVTSFRWILYSPSQITRGLLLCFLLSATLIWLDSQIKSRRLKDQKRR